MNSFAISSKGVGDALLRSSSAMHAAGNTLDETVALATAANTIVQNPENVGTSLKTVSMYLRAAKTELEEAGESTENMVSNVSELRGKILGITEGVVDIQIDDDTFKSTYQILSEIASVWNDISDVDQAALTELMGGKRNANVISALMENFSVAEEVLATSAGAAGSALEENEKVLESIQGRLNLLAGDFQSFSDSFLNSGFVKFGIDALRGVLNFFEGMSNAISGFGTLLVTSGVIWGLTSLKKNFD